MPRCDSQRGMFHCDRAAAWQHSGELRAANEYVARTIPIHSR
jgi:hypothetical protein